MRVNMVVWLLFIPSLGMVLMVHIMTVPVSMLQGLVRVHVLMPFGQMQPDAGGH
jgi:hypothetical protein